MRSQGKQGGGVLVLVLLVVALVLSIGVQSVDKIHFTFNQVIKTVKDDQSYWYALGLESTASNFLVKHNTEKHISKLLMFDNELPQIQYSMKGSVVEGSLTDLSSCFNFI